MRKAQLLNRQDLVRAFEELDVSLRDSMWKRLTDPPLTVLQFQGTTPASALCSPSEPSRKLEIKIRSTYPEWFSRSRFSYQRLLQWRLCFIIQHKIRDGQRRFRQGDRSFRNLADKDGSESLIRERLAPVSFDFECESCEETSSNMNGGAKGIALSEVSLD